MSAEDRYILTTRCQDRVGIVARVAQFIADYQGWILESHHHTDSQSGQYFMRLEIRADSLPFDGQEFARRFEPLATEFAMYWKLADSRIKKKVALLVSREDHCFNDLLSHWRQGELQMDIPCVISNHPHLRDLVTWHGLPFHHIPIPATAEGRKGAFAKIGVVLMEADVEILVLARFMQILPSELCRAYAGRALNIHHSFLPSFAGARPYHQAVARGVKLIGATCHYVTEELDDGPIIEQDTVRIDHGDDVQDLVRYGRDIERMVLSRGLRYHLEDRVLLYGHRTVVFR